MAENLGIQGNNLSSASFSAEELLSYLAQNGKIDLNSAEEEMRKSQMDQILDQHPYSIYQGSNGRWYTYLPDDTKKNRRRKIERTSEEDIKHALYEFYNGIAEHTDYCDQIYNHIVTEAFGQAVKFKSNYQPPRDTTTWLRNEQETSFQSIKVYIETGIFEQKAFEQEILKLQNELSAQISNNDPYNLIYQEYFLHSQAWCEKQLAEMLHQLEDNKYPISFYAKIIVAIQRLVDLGFDQAYMQRAKEAMLNNITNMGELTPIDSDLWFVDDRKFKENVASIVADINSAIKDHSEIASRKTVEEILEYSDWVERLEKYINPTQSNWFPSIAVFSKAPAEKWVAVIDEATPDIIYNFRHLLGKVYPSNEKRDCYSIDAETIHQLFDAISNMEPNDLIKKASLDWLHFQFGEIIKLYEPEVKEETGLMRSE